LSPDNPDPAVHVVAAAVIDREGRVLIAQRPPGKHLAGGWEFPGGKLHPREDRRVGLARELKEEIGIEIRTPRPLLRLRHTYDYGEVLLDMWVVRHYNGEPRGLDGQALRWCTQEALEATELLPADKPIVAALRLPQTLTRLSTPDYAIEDACTAPDARLHGMLCADARDAVAASTAGADFLILRDILAPAMLTYLCEAVSVPVFARGLTLEEAWGLGASGINEISAGASRLVR
jgi:8-oxo-dGTP diphosphatase